MPLLTRRCFSDPAGSHSDRCYCCGYGHWHFLLAGTLKTLPWPLALSLCLSFHFLPLLFSSSFLLSFSPPSFIEMSKPASNLLLPLSEFVSILTTPLPLCSTYHGISLSSLIQHPLTTFSASMLPPHSALSLSLSLSTYLSLLPALPLHSAFQTLLPLVFHVYKYPQRLIYHHCSRGNCS